jgi:hypothetical protein
MYSAFRALVAITDSGQAAAQQLPYYIDLVEERNVMAWMEFRFAVRTRLVGINEKTITKDKVSYHVHYYTL